MDKKEAKKVTIFVDGEPVVGNGTFEIGDTITGTNSGALAEIKEISGETITVSFEANTDEGFQETLKEFFFGGDNMGIIPPPPPPRLRIPKGGDNVIAQPTRRIMDHTRMRFNSMTIRQLWTRMGKMSKVDKLNAFAIVAEERGHMDLSIAAKARMASITGDSSILSGIVAKPKPKVKKGERLLRRMDG